MANALNAEFFASAYHELDVAATPTPLMQIFGQRMENRFGSPIQVDVYPAQRTPAPTNQIGGTSKVIQKKGVTPRFYTPIHSFNRMPFDPVALMHLRQQDNPAVQDRGKQEIERQMTYFKRAHNMLREVALHKTFLEGVIYRDPDGNITPTDQGGQTIDLGVPAANKTSLGGIIAADWDDPAALIFTQLNNLRRAAIAAGKPEPKHIFITNLAKNWIRANTEAKAYFQNANLSPESVDRILQGETFPDLGGYTWHFYDQSYVDYAGTTRLMLSETIASITPEPGGWFQAFNGAAPVPTSVNLVDGDSAESIAAYTKVAYGDFFYMLGSQDPVGVNCYGGTTFLYAFTDPSAVYMPTVNAS